MRYESILACMWPLSALSRQRQHARAVEEQCDGENMASKTNQTCLLPRRVRQLTFCTMRRIFCACVYCVAPADGPPPVDVEHCLFERLAASQSVTIVQYRRASQVHAPLHRCTYLLLVYRIRCIATPSTDGPRGPSTQPTDEVTAQTHTARCSIVVDGWTGRPRGRAIGATWQSQHIRLYKDPR